MATNPYTINNSLDFFLNEYLSQYRVKITEHSNNSFPKNTYSHGISEGRLKSIISFDAGEQITTDGVEPVYKQRVRFVANEESFGDREEWQEFVNNLIADQNITYHQSNYNIPNNEIVTPSQDNELFAESHAFYQFRLRSYEIHQEGKNEIDLPSFINAVYYNKYPNYQKARDLYTFNDAMDTDTRFITKIPGVNPTYKLFNNHLFKRYKAEASQKDTYFALKKNYFYDFADFGVSFGPDENEKHKNIFIMFDYNSEINKHVLEVPYFNHIKLGYNNSFIKDTDVKDAFDDVRMPEILMSILRNSSSDPVVFDINGTNATIGAIDFVSNIFTDSFASVENDDETFMVDPVASMFDDNPNELEMIFRRMILAGKIRAIMLSQQKSFSDFFPKRKQGEQYKEFIAYKITKQKLVENQFRTVQTFYTYSYDKVQSIVDSQINLDQLYRYNITSFFLICGHEVSFENIRTCDKQESDFWYDGNVETSELVNNMDGGRFNARATFVAKPSWKIIEIPVSSKLMRVVEPPPIEPKVTFRDVDGKNNKIKIIAEDPFEVNIFDNDRKPMVSFNGIEQDYYNKLIRYTYTPRIYSTFAASDSVFDVYRLEEKPKSMMDFSDALYHTIQSNEIDEFGDRDVMSSMFDYLEHQKKYYYIVRTRTHRNNLSNPSPIYVVEKFKDADETILKVDTMTINEDIDVTMETKFRRFMQVNIDERHLFVRNETYQNIQSAVLNRFNILLGQDDVNYESIWSYGGNNTNNDNKFIKLRLESKRTGKKIDLNFYFKIQIPNGNS